MKNFSNKVDKYKKYPKVFIRPDQSFEDRLTHRILIAGAKTIPGNIKCVFNNQKILNMNLDHLLLIMIKQLLIGIVKLNIQKQDFPNGKIRSLLVIIID